MCDAFRRLRKQFCKGFGALDYGEASLDQAWAGPCLLASMGRGWSNTLWLIFTTTYCVEWFRGVS